MKIKFEYKELNSINKNIIELFKSNGINEEENYDTVVVLGGDGTFFYSVQKYKDINNFVLINTGSLGFYSSCEKEEVAELISAIKNNELINNKLEMLNIVIDTLDKKYCINAINDIMIRSTNYKSAYLELYINDKKLESIAGDGILVSTSYGSTAYNLSLGGPVFTDSKNICITPLNPIINKNNKLLKNSLILNKENDIVIKPIKKTKDIIINKDGLIYRLNNVNSIKFSNSKRYLNIISTKKIDFIDKIINKII